jgi:hypothetical protein
VGEVTGFTPGPWNLVTNKFGEHVVAAGDNDIFLLDDTESSVSNHDEYTANARLVAAAPELYEACRDALALLNWDVITAEALNQVGHTLAAAINKADAA